jgi:hypothetical protein
MYDLSKQVSVRLVAEELLLQYTRDQEVTATGKTRGPHRLLLLSPLARHRCWPCNTCSLLGEPDNRGWPQYTPLYVFAVTSAKAILTHLTQILDPRVNGQVPHTPLQNLIRPFLRDWDAWRG